MKKLILGSLLTSTMTMAAATGGGNGGDVIKCSVNGQSVYRTLDSVVMESQPFFEKVEERNSETSMRQIVEKLKNTLPLMGKRLATFKETFDKKANDDRSIFWIDAKLYDVQDENLYIRIPENCDEKLLQAVNLVKSPFKRYYFDSEVLGLIEKEGDELSWLIVHEWLRDFIDDSDVIRIVNAYIHSQDFLDASDIEVDETLGRLGITSGRGKTVSELESTVSKLRSGLPTIQERIAEVHSRLDFAQDKNQKAKIKVWDGLDIIDLMFLRNTTISIAIYTSEFKTIELEIEQVLKRWEHYLD
ncbi:MAG: hypothetical protein KC478_01565 [Bacteriovoracaceae bacterium]|nr:hypothetical protein [Bacteriovoracaceae bacterium]